MKKAFVLLTLIMVATAMISAGTSGGAKPTNGSAVTPHGSSPAPLPKMPQDAPGTIDGAANPQAIPDATAYALLFNFFAGRDESERGKLKAYCKQTMLADVELDGLLTVAKSA